VPALDKWKLAARIGVALAAVARNSGDPVGLVIAQGDRSLTLPPRMRRTVTHEIIRAVAEVRPGGNDPLAASVSIASRAGGRVVVVSDLLGDAAELTATSARLVAAGREVHVVHVLAREEVDPPRDASMMFDPESPEVRRALTAETRDTYLTTFGQWREDVAHELTGAGVAYFAAVVGEEATDHLIRRITLPRGFATVA
jgi:uncharacterized protein (DUF58 family)